MPVKRRESKRRIDPQAEANAWSTYWETGFDFFGEAQEMCGLDDGTEAFKAASQEAWQRVGYLSGLEAPHAS